VFREIHFKPYRIIYQIVESDVYIHAVLDGRRDLQELLEIRLLR
jgi:toxin ParE1/3/4